MVYDFNTGQFRSHLHLTEQKTKKETMIALNRMAVTALELLRQNQCPIQPGACLFAGQKDRTSHISRQQAYRIIKKPQIMPACRSISAVTLCGKLLVTMPGKTELLRHF